MEMKIKTWIIDKIQHEASKYNTYLDIAKRTNDIAHQPLIEDGCYFMKISETLEETEKAIKLKFSSGEIDGSYKGWTAWVPKSQIM